VGEEQALPLPLAQAAAAATPLRLGLSVAFPQTTQQLVEALRGQVRRQGRKFSKAESLYMPAPIIPPAAWRYECQTCRFWQPVGQQWAFPTCEIVGLPGDPFGGEAVHPLHWCGYWVNPQGDPPLRWLAEWLDPSLKPSRGEL
jgi:hypothetical protein